MELKVRSLLVFFVSFVFNLNLNAQEINDSIYDNSKVYTLGEIIISPLDVADDIRMEEIEKLNIDNLAQSAAMIPSVTLNKSGLRNESSVYVRGFDIRSVPLFIDGIPVYVPYDGYIDLGRFMVNDISKIEVSRGYSSILYGPNTIGGAINIINSKPKDKIDLKLGVGIYSVGGKTANFDFGSKLGKFYFQGNFSMNNRDFVPLSHDFDTTFLQTSYKLDNSYSDDSKVNLKIGYESGVRSEYSLNYIYQYAKKGNPVYLGDDTSIRRRYWQWPKWDKQSLYFISKTGITDRFFVKSRIYYDNFINQLKGFDDNTYSTQIGKSTFTSNYDDYSIGVNLESDYQFNLSNTIKFAVYFKNDNHSENNEGDPSISYSDNTMSYGIEDVYNLSNKFTIIPGISYNVRQSLKAEEYISSTELIQELPSNHSTGINSQIAFIFNDSPKRNFKFTVANKTRFASMKDRYSYKLGYASPNPDLKPESAINLDLETAFSLNAKVEIKPSVFYSHLKNTIQLIDNVEPGISQVQNTGKSVYYGGDFTFNYKFTKNLKLNLIYSYIKRDNVTEPELKFTDVPTHNLVAFLEGKILKNLDFVIFSQYSSDRYSTSYGDVSPAFNIYNFNLSYKFFENITIAVGIDNIFDTNYTLTEGYPEAGRSYNASLVYNFIKK